MGNTESTSFIGKNVNPSEYQLVGKVHNIRWGELFEMNHIKARKRVFMQEKHSNTLEKHQNLARLCAQRVTLSHRNLAIIYGAASNNTPDVFTNTYKACIFFEHMPQSLQTLIDNKTFHYSKPSNFRQSTRLPDYFEEAQILSLIREFVNVFSYLQKNGICQGDITPDVCFISEDGTPKVLEKAFIFHAESAIDTALRSNSGVFLTPAELETIANQDVPLTEDKFKADVFRLGLTLLECATLKKSSQIYNWDDFLIDMDVLSSRLAEVQERYSPEIFEKLRQMLRLDEYKRPDFLSLAGQGQGQQSRPTPNPREYTSSKSMGQLNRPQKEPLAKSMTSIGIGPKLTAHIPLQSEKYPKSTSNADARGYHNQRGHQRQRQNQNQGNVSRRENLRDEDIEEFDDTARINRVPHIDPYNASFDSKERSLNASSIMQHRNSVHQDDNEDDSHSNTTVKSLSLSRPSLRHGDSMERQKFSFHNNYHTASPQRGNQQNNNAARPAAGFDLQQWKQTKAQTQNAFTMKSPQNSSQNRQRNSIFTQGTARSDFHHPQLIDLQNIPHFSKNTRSTSQTPTARSQQKQQNLATPQRTPPRVQAQTQKPSHISLNKINYEPRTTTDNYSPRFPTQQQKASFKGPAANQPDEKDLVESILRNVMSHAGISPVKQPQKRSIISHTEHHDAERSFQRPQEADQQNYQPQVFSRNYYNSKTPTAKPSFLQRPDLSGGHQKYNSDIKPSNSGFVSTYQSYKTQPENHMPETQNQYQYRTNPHTREPSQRIVKEPISPERDGTVNVDNRFEMAMQRSQRSVGYMKNLAQHMESRSISTGGGSAQKRLRPDDY